MNFRMIVQSSVMMATIKMEMDEVLHVLKKLLTLDLKIVDQHYLMAVNLLVEMVSIPYQNIFRHLRT